jgi:hypothetical protein
VSESALYVEQLAARGLERYADTKGTLLKCLVGMQHMTSTRQRPTLNHGLLALAQYVDAVSPLGLRPPVHSSPISRPPQFANQPEKIDLTPGLGDLVPGYAVNHEPGEFDCATRTRNAFELALMRRPSSRTKHNPIALGDQVIDRVVRIGKCGAKLPLKPLEFGPVHRGGAHVTDVVGSNEWIEAAGKASVRERNPAADEFLVSVSVRELHRQYSSEVHERGLFITAELLRTFQGV